MEQLVQARNNTFSFVYQKALRPLFFSFDPETIHDSMIASGEQLSQSAISRKLVQLAFGYENPMLEQTILGIHFSNPVGLAAGFDKDARLTKIIGHIGFGFEEVGSITAKPSDGNPKPRLWRLPESKALVVNYGLKNLGAKVLAKKLKNQLSIIPIGTSIAKTNCLETVETERGIADYVEGFKAFTEIGEYFTINISCPNTFGGQPFTDAKKLHKLLNAIDKVPTKKPIFLKFSPDLSLNEVDALLAVGMKHRVHGFVVSNLTKPRKNPKVKDQLIPQSGGMSGKVVEDLANELIRYVFTKTKGHYVIVGCGGIFTSEDAYTKIKLGATLVQLITGMVYQGPQVISQINQGLVSLLKKDGYTNISEAIGADVH